MTGQVGELEKTNHSRPIHLPFFSSSFLSMVGWDRMYGGNEEVSDELTTWTGDMSSPRMAHDAMIAA